MTNEVNLNRADPVFRELVAALNKSFDKITLELTKLKAQAEQLSRQFKEQAKDIPSKKNLKDIMEELKRLDSLLRRKGEKT